jgi:hypothetical protein
MRSPNATTILRALPSLLALGLLAFAVLGATDPDAPRAVPDAMVYPNCSIVVQSAPAESAASLAPGGVVVQPLGTTFAIAACSLAVLVPPIRASEFLGVVSWDPVALAPDPTTAALRNETFYLSISVEKPDYSGGNLRVKVNIAISSYPAKSLIAPSSKSATMAGVAPGSRASEDQLLDAVAAAAAKQFADNAHAM